MVDKAVGCIILAAGLSRRMGEPKLVMPWKKTTVIEHVVNQFVKSGIDNITVITGGYRDEVTSILNLYDLDLVFNSDYMNQEMITSIQVGLKQISGIYNAVVIALGDQPQIQSEVIEGILEKYQGSNIEIIIPSYQMKRGHPWLISAIYWQEIIDLKPPYTMRDFFQNHSKDIIYFEVNTPSILQDLDTPDDYRRFHPNK